MNSIAAFISMFLFFIARLSFPEINSFISDVNNNFTRGKISKLGACRGYIMINCNCQLFEIPGSSSSRVV